MKLVARPSLVQQTLCGVKTPRAPVAPLAVHYCARLAGVSVRRYSTDPHTMADCIGRYFDEFQPDAVWLSADTWVNAQAMGARVAFPSDEQPMCGTGTPLIQNAADIDRIPLPDPGTQGRWPVMLEALTRLRQRLGRPTCLVACFDQYPFSLACAVMGIQELMLKLLDDRPFVMALLEKCEEFTVAYASALAAAGADLLSGGDSPAGLIGPDLYGEVAWPFELRAIDRIKRATGLPVSLHICGNATPMLPQMASTGADILEIDHQVDLGLACQIVGPQIALWGNLDPVGLLAQGAPEDVQQAAGARLLEARSQGHQRFVLSSGCTLAMETPAANVHALIAAATVELGGAPP